MHMVSPFPLAGRDASLTQHAALVTGQLAHDLRIIGQEIEKVYGVLSEEDLRLQ